MRTINPSCSPGARTLTLASGATPFLDGFSTASAAFLISLIDGFSALQIAFFTSFYMFGGFLGAALIGSISDRLGRRKPYLLAMALVAVFVTLAAASPKVAVLLAMRLVTGVALGGDYPVCQAMVAEHIEEKRRAKSLTFLMLAWYFGALAAVACAWPAVSGFWNYTSILWCQAAIAVVALLARTTIPESSSWLNRQMQNDDTEKEDAPLHVLLRSMRKALSTHKREFAFCTGFWLCQTIPATIMMLYSPLILQDIAGSENAFVQMVILYGCFLLGVIPSGWDVFSKRPKTVLSTTFIAMMVGLICVELFAGHSSWLTNLAFVIFAVSYGLQSPLDFIYPNTLFHTEVRGTLVGLVTAVSRIGSAGSAFLFPLLQTKFEIHDLMLCGVAVLGLGFFIAQKWAPADKPNAPF